MSLYDELADVSLELLTEFGQSVTRRSYTVGTYDPATGANTVVTSDTTRKGAIFDIGLASGGVQTLRGNLVQSGDMRLIVDAEAAINLQDHFIVNGVEYVIVGMDEVSPAGTRVLFDLHVRR
jgi:hypothetical protein